jgi:hypothetical protein
MPSYPDYRGSQPGFHQEGRAGRGTRRDASPSTLTCKSASTTLPQHHFRTCPSAAAMADISLPKRPPEDAPGRTRTCDPLLRRGQQMLQSTAASRQDRSASDGPHIAAAFCCGSSLPQRFHMSDSRLGNPPPLSRRSDGGRSWGDPLPLLVRSEGVASLDRDACFKRESETGLVLAFQAVSPEAVSSYSSCRCHHAAGSSSLRPSGARSSIR